MLRSASSLCLFIKKATSSMNRRHWPCLLLPVVRCRVRSSLMILPDGAEGYRDPRDRQMGRSPPASIDAVTLPSITGM